MAVGLMVERVWVGVGMVVGGESMGGLGCWWWLGRGPATDIGYN